MNSDDQRRQLGPGDGLAESRGAEVGVFVAILIAVALGAVRLMRGDSVRVVAGAVLVFSLFVEITGEGRGFYLPEVALSVVMTVLHSQITLAWFVFWAAHVAVMVPLYLADKVVLLGTFALVFGKPALVVLLALTWLWVREKSTAQAGAA
ncbi:DUF3159 domain-containing protein [Nocardia colli]|uniref:DUF3159 domain-containing protein n=1 Tax=Nocardia colli TaxID=2545717 RepID=UPI0035DA5ECC